MTAAAPAPLTSPPVAPRPVKRWPGRVAALVTVGLFGAGSVVLADWLRERSELDARLEHGVTGPPEPLLATQPAQDADPRMTEWLDANVRYGPARKISFGRDRAWFTAGTAMEGPEDVFPRLLARLAASFDARAGESYERQGPSAAAALRLSASVGTIPGGASLVRLPPDVAAISHGTLRTEPGVVVLAIQGHMRWEYLTFYFPQGLDLDALIRSSKPNAHTLDVLGPDAVAVLEPALSLSGDDRAGGPSTVLCKAHGRAGDAIDRVADSLSRRGWRDAEEGIEVRRPESRVMAGPDATVWMTTADREQVDGMVTVLVGPP